MVAKGTPGFSGADLENLVNEAALLAARANKNEVNRQDLDSAKDKVMMGAERRSMVITEEEKKVTAYHEAGHALVAMFIPGADPVHKVSIIPRGRAMGVTMYLPTEEKYNETKAGPEYQDMHPPGWPGRRGTDLRKCHQRGFKRPGASDCHRPQDGVRVGDE